MTLSKDDLKNSLFNKLDLSRKKSSQVIETLLELIKKTLEHHEDILISGFGKFCTKKKNQRKGRNPATGEDLILEPRRVITFKCSAVLKDKMNGT